METKTSNTALLVMDMQQGIMQMFPSAEQVRNNTLKAIKHARAKKIQVIYVVVGFRPGLPEISPNNKSFSTSKERFANANMEEWMKVDSALSPQNGEITVVKRRVSAFAGSDLEVVLRAAGITHLVLSGIATSGVVLSTTREAADKDYRLSILSDCCGDSDEEVHRVLTTKVLARQADVLTADEWISKNG
jgi:nicotinamidase-related amidase